jgi:hypothetical protein
VTGGRHLFWQRHKQDALASQKAGAQKPGAGLKQHKG